MIFRNILLLAPLLFVLASCAYFPEVDEARGVPIGDPFKNHLKDGYIELADFEAAQGDKDDEGHYRYKAYSIIVGHSIDPESLKARKIPVDHLNELADARNFLMSSFARKAHEIVPLDAAEAQLKFDCWVEQQEENFQPEHIAACKESFMIAKEKIRDALTVKPVEVEPVQMPAPFQVFFAFDSSKIGAPAQEVLQQIAQEVGVFKPSKIMLSGHADRSGAEKYNFSLSEKRANKVAQQLEQFGVDKALLDVRAYGETVLKVQTADGVKEPQNRFVEIIFVR